MEATVMRGGGVAMQAARPALASGLAWGLAGGLAGTLVMDAALMAGLAAVGLPPLACFSLVGDTVARFLSLAGVGLSGGVPLGVATHYVVGPAFGLLFGAMVCRIEALRVDSRRKGVLLAVLYVEILSQPILATTPILLSMNGGRDRPVVRRVLRHAFPAGRGAWPGGQPRAEAKGGVMHLVDERVLGVAILCLLAVLVTVKRLATGTILDKPRGGLLVRLVDTFNLFFLLVVNPLAAVLLILRQMAAVDPTRVIVADPRVLAAVEIAGMVLYAAGFLLMAWALVTLARNYQLGGIAPRAGDRLVVDGPYRFVRHPMYTAALSIALGLAGLTQSLAVLAVFGIYLALILRLVGVEEAGLQAAYGERYVAYQARSGRLIPFVD